MGSNSFSDFLIFFLIFLKTNLKGKLDLFICFQILQFQLALVLDLNSEIRA